MAAPLYADFELTHVSFLVVDRETGLICVVAMTSFWDQLEVCGVHGYLIDRKGARTEQVRILDWRRINDLGYYSFFTPLYTFFGYLSEGIARDGERNKTRPR